MLLLLSGLTSSAASSMFFAQNQIEGCRSELNMFKLSGLASSKTLSMRQNC
jgi:hypothetical protein